MTVRTGARSAGGGNADGRFSPRRQGIAIFLAGGEDSLEGTLRGRIFTVPILCNRIREHDGPTCGSPAAG